MSAAGRSSRLPVRSGLGTSGGSVRLDAGRTNFRFDREATAGLKRNWILGSPNIGTDELASERPRHGCEA